MTSFTWLDFFSHIASNSWSKWKCMRWACKKLKLTFVILLDWDNTFRRGRSTFIFGWTYSCTWMSYLCTLEPHLKQNLYPRFSFYTLTSWSGDTKLLHFGFGKMVKTFLPRGHRLRVTSSRFPKRRNTMSSKFDLKFHDENEVQNLVLTGSRTRANLTLLTNVPPCC